MRVISPMWEVALVKSILQTEQLIYIAKCLRSFSVTKCTSIPTDSDTHVITRIQHTSQIYYNSDVWGISLFGGQSNHTMQFY